MLKLIAFLAAVSCALGAGPALADITIDVNQAAVQPLPIAIAAVRRRGGRAISDVVSADLERSGLFRPLDPATFREHPDVGVDARRFDPWKAISAQALLVGQRRPPARTAASASISGCGTSTLATSWSARG